MPPHGTLYVSTPQLIQLLTDLSHTAATDPDAGAIAGVLVHISRGHVGEDPGETSLLVGTSTNTSVVGHARIGCDGHLAEPMLWPISEVRSVISVFKPAAKADKMHHVAIRRDGYTVTISELDDPALFESGDGRERLQLSFALGTVADFPYIWPLLEIHDIREVLDQETGRAIPAAPRVDVSHPALTPFTKISRSRGGAPIELYVYHQRRAVHVQIGETYRGVLMPSKWDDLGHTESSRVQPAADVCVPERHYFESVQL